MARITKSTSFVLAAILVTMVKPHPSHRNPHGLEEECPVAVSTRRESCEAIRLQDIEVARRWYDLTDANTTRPLKFPFKNLIPWLNQTTDMIQYYYSMDPFESRYMILVMAIGNAVNTRIAPQLLNAFKKSPFVSNKEYAAFFNAWNGALKMLQTPQYFSHPSQFPDFTDHITNGYWTTDESFTQRRLSGLCPIFMRKVLSEGKVGGGISLDKLSSVLNRDFFQEFEMSLNEHIKITFEQAIKDGRLFVQYIEEMNDVVNSNIDLTDQDPTDDRTLRKLHSPIAFFVLREDGNLAVVAIQKDAEPDSRVLTPMCDAEEWLLLKAQVEQTAMQYCHGKIHLGGVHFVTTVYCLTFRRHLSAKHPLYDFFKYHCEGTVPHITLSFSRVTGKGESIDKIFSVGADGSRNLARKAIDERDYETFTYDWFIKDQGMDDKRLKYYPFRDDSKLLLDELENFSEELVGSIYGYGGCWIENDLELQNWVQELSGGKGRMVNFPTKLRTNKQLVTFINRFLWYNLLHTAVNYAAPEFRPTSPAKLYQNKDGRPLTLLESLPDAVHSVITTTFLGSISSVRINRIFGYWEKITDKNFRRISRKYHHTMNVEIQQKLEERNAERKSKNKLGFQYLEPKWLTNSIHI